MPGEELYSNVALSDSRFVEVFRFTTLVVPRPDVKGNGYLAGEFPGGTTTVDGVPSSATVRVLFRPSGGHPGDGYVIAETTSNPDGTWRVDGLNHSLRYDVVGRKEGFNDVIMSNITPAID